MPRINPRPTHARHHFVPSQDRNVLSGGAPDTSVEWCTSPGSGFRVCDSRFQGVRRQSAGERAVQLPATTLRENPSNAR
jgi:hypothetical protein